MPQALHARHVRLRTLGALDLSFDDGSELTDLLSRPKELALIIYLATGTEGGYVTRDSLLPLFWPELDEKHARHALRQMLYSLRRSLGPGGVRCRSNREVGLDPERVVCDASELLNAARSGDLETVATLYRGDFLTGFNPGDVSAELEHWIDHVRGQVREAAIHAVRSLAEAAERARDRTAAIRWSRTATEIEPLSEADAHRLVRLLGEAGAIPLALEAYERYRLRLKSDLTLPPGPEIQQEIRGLRERQRQGGPATRGTLRPPVRVGEVPVPVPASMVPDRREGGRERGWTRRRILVLSGAALAVLLILVLGRPLIRGGAAPAPSLPRLAIIPIPAEGARPAEGRRLAYASAWALSDATGIRVVDPGTVQGLLQRADESATQDLLHLVRRELGAEVVLTSQVWPNDSDHLVRLALWNLASGQAAVARRTLALSGKGQEELEAPVEAMVEFIRATLPGVGIPSGPRMPQTTAEALDAYVLGDGYLHRGEPGAALREFQRAVDADTAFALAWHRLSVAAGLVFDGALADSAADRASRVTHGLPPRLDLLIEARRAYRKGAPQQAETALRALLVLDPDDVEAQHQLAEVLLHFNPIRGRAAAEALPLFGATAGLGAAQPEALYHMAQLSLLAGDTAAFGRHAAELLSLSAAAYRAPQVRVLQAHVSGDPVRWRRELARLESDGDFSVLSAAHNVAIYGRSPSAASDVARLLTDESRAAEVRSLGHRVLADLALARGRAREAWDLLERAEGDQPESTLVHTALMAALPTVPVDSALLSDIRSRVSATGGAGRAGSWFFPERPLYPELTDYLKGILALKAGQGGEAAKVLRSLGADPAGRGSGGLFRMLSQRYRLFTGALSSPETEPLSSTKVKAEQAALSPLFSSPDLRYLYALKAEQAGQHRLALRLLASLEENSIPDLALAGPARLAAAQIYERLGELEEAARQYLGAVELWADADPEYQGLIDSAREGLGGLGLGGSEGPSRRRFENTRE